MPKVAMRVTSPRLPCSKFHSVNIYSSYTSILVEEIKQTNTESVKDVISKFQIAVAT